MEPVENPESFNCATTDPSSCPDCHKCAQLVDENGSFDGTICVPVATDPQDIGESCSDGQQPGYDDCGDDAVCWNADEDGRNGICAAHCAMGKACADGFDCLSTSAAPIACLPACDPLNPDCGDGEQCLPFGNTGYICYPDIELPGAGETCFGACGEGLGCVPAEIVAGCETESCCAPLCEEGGTQCDATGQTCVPNCAVYLPGDEHGACGTLPDPLPQNCPPPGIDPNIPWCNDSNNSACPEPDVGFGFGDDCVEECSCGTTCDDVSECPTPATGTATRRCAPVFEGDRDDICLLSCADGETCPDGMHCSGGYPGLCVWFTELEPGCLD